MADEFLQAIQEAVKTKVRLDAAIKILVVGRSKAGKSHFIQKFLNIPADHPLLAEKTESNRKQGLVKVLKYERRDEMPDIAVYDAVGITSDEDTKLTPEAYCKEVKIERFDVAILMTADTFTKEELDLYEYISKLKAKPHCFLVTSHFDCHVESQLKENDESVESATSAVREAFKSKLTDRDLELYFVNNKKPDQHDFPKLQHDIKNALSNEKRRLAEKRLFLLSEEDVRKKADAWRRDLPLHSIPGGISGLSPIPGTDLVAEMGIIAYETTKLYRDFGLSESKLSEVCETYGLPRGTAQEIREHFQFARIDIDTIKNIVSDREKLVALIGNFVKWGVAGIVVNSTADVAKMAPVIGTAIGCAIGGVMGYFTTWFILKAVIDGCEQDGLTAVRELRRLLDQQAKAP